MKADDALRSAVRFQWMNLNAESYPCRGAST
jgi:hypothetical protein